MKIVKRDGSFQQLNTNKIIYRVRKLCKDKKLGVLRNIDPDEIAVETCSRVFDGITSSDIDEIAARLAYERYTQHEEFGTLAARIMVSNMHKNTHECFSEVMKILNENIDEHGDKAPVVSDDFLQIVEEYRHDLDFMPDYSRDYLFDYFGYKTLEFGYLMRVFEKKTYNADTDTYVSKHKIVERPQHMWMRVAIQIHGRDIDRVRETYELMSQRYFTHATPTLFNSGSQNPQLSSCFLIATKDDSIDGIFSTLKDCSMISKFSGGIGLHVHNVRANGSRIRGTNGRGDGIVPMLRVFNETAKYVNQGSRRKGSFAIYLSPDHADIEDFLQLKLTHGDDNRRARDLFYALWIPDLFMKQVEEDQDWYLMCPDESPGLADVYGDEYEQLYWKYVKEERFRKKIRARDLYKKIIKSQIETGTPYVLYKDACNKKSNQKNIGTIKSSNLCVAPETKILTEHGYHEIQNMSGKKTRVWNGREWSETIVMKTGEDQELMKITFSNGSIIECTPYHKFYITDGPRNQKKRKIEAKDLKQNMKLIKCDFPTIIDGEEMENAYIRGFCCGDGTNIIPEKYYVPINYNLESKLRWFEGFSDSKGSIINNQNCQDLQIRSIHKDLLENVKLMLQTTGTNPEIHPCNKNCHRLILNSTDLQQLRNLGYSPKRLIVNDHVSNRDARGFIKVESVEYTGRISTTYCFNEPNRNMGIFNGVLAGNCAEIVQYSSPEEIATCNLGSIALSRFVEKKSFNFEKLHQVTKILTRNLNNVIDKNMYPVPETLLSNERHRPIGIGVQGLADVYIMMRYPFDSENAAALNKKIFETIYHAALESSCEMAQEFGPYQSFQGSPASKGILQFDLWGRDPGNERYNWTDMKEQIQKHGLRNSLLTACMPTASTSNILGNIEACEPLTSNIYSRRVLSGDYVIMNKYLFRELSKLGLWNKDMKDLIISENGSIQNIPLIPEETKQLFKTAYEISPRVILNQAADRGAFVCQSQSTNIFLENPTIPVVGSVLAYGHKLGLKTGMYYLRSKAAARAIQISVDQKKMLTKLEELKNQETTKQESAEDNMVCVMEEGCVTCSS